jgi:hypothetical protein
MDQLTNANGSSYICKMPFRMLPQPFKNRTKTRYATRSQVRAAFANSLLSAVYDGQFPLGVDSVVEFFFQCLKNAFEEHLFIENESNTVAGCYGVHLKRFKVKGTKDPAVPASLRQFLQTDRRNSSHRCLSIVDLGRGIPRSLSSFGIGNALTEREQVNLAFQPGITTKKTVVGEQQPGFGLSNAWASCLTLQGLLLVETGGLSLISDSRSQVPQAAPSFSDFPDCFGSEFGCSFTLVWQEV